jgi:hypothetical protein
LACYPLPPSKLKPEPPPALPDTLDDLSVFVAPVHSAHVGMMLVNDEAVSVRIVVLEPSTGAVLAQSAALPMNLMR